MEGKSLYILAGYDDNTEKILADMQSKLYDQGFSGSQTKDIPMHFTLGQYTVDQEEELKERFKGIAETMKSFEVSFNHVGLFNLPASEVLFVAPDVSKDMLALKDNFMDSKDQFDWSAHTTLLIDKPEEIQKAIPQVMDDFSSFKGKVTTLYLYEFWPTRHILTVQLG
ncbi:MAG: 2'-5' RNA ligase family protein [Eubacterium sp.]|nr:2'-5' RNA ligase family protein [Eubacterium sp.]